MRIGIDAMGGDFAPQESVTGAYFTKQAHPSWELVLYGDESRIRSIMGSEGMAPDSLEIVHCPQIIEMSEHPVRALASKPDSSIAIGFKELAEEKIEAFLSAGNTGAMLVGALSSVKAIPGILRPCLTSIVPREDGHPGLLLDVGANSDVKPEHLQQFALLGSLFYTAVYQKESPTVALLNLGEEDEKGSLLTRAAYPLLAGTREINFVGNVEARDIFNDEYDVIVCDGFTGNVVIKLCEGLFYKLAKRGVQDEFLDKFNFKHYGGSAILGVNAPVIVGHGITKSTTFVKMIEMAAKEVEGQLVKHIRDSMVAISDQN